MNIPTASQLKQGLVIAEKIASLEAEMAALFGGQPRTAPEVKSSSAPARAKTGKRRLSPQALANIRAAQKKRWAKFKSAKGGAKPVAISKAEKPQKKKGTITPAGRAKLAAAMKARWAAARKRGGPPPTAKKS